MRASVVAVVALFVAAGLVSIVHARPVGIWKEADLWEQADVVVLGTPTSTADATERFAAEKGRENWVAVETVFGVQATLKGESGKSITVRHARYSDPKMSVPNGPVFVEFDPDQQRQFLIFLKRTAAGRYEPLTGQLDPYMSFRLVLPYEAIYDLKK